MGDIFRAAREGNEKEVIRLLNAEPALLERGNNGGIRPLVVAAHRGHLGVLRLLIEKGANINATRAGGNTPLHYAAGRGYEELVALLLSKGAHANSRDRRGMTPCMWASDNGHLGVVKMLAQHMGGQGLEERSEDGCTALHCAAYWGREEVVRFLLLAGADPTITDNEGTTPRAITEQNHHIEIVREGRARCVAVLQVRPLTCGAHV
jgi:ankyrin repeat protein